MRVLVITDAWKPQVNGVVRTLEHLQQEAPAHGAEVRFLTPERFRTVPMPGYPEIRLSLASPRAIAAAIESERPDAIHIATEGPLGVMARRWALANKQPFTTCYHTRYPQYISARYPVPERVVYAMLRRFHNAAATTLVATESLKSELTAKGFNTLSLWSRGIDGALFRPHAVQGPLEVEGPIFLSIGRVAVEKNLEAFLSLDLPGTKVIVGDGPDRERLQKAYPAARFLGVLTGQALADIYAQAQCFVFPSRTDTFGLVLLEALSSGVPVASFPGAGLVGDIGINGCGVLSEDLEAAALSALAISADHCRSFALRFSHANATQQFLSSVKRANADAICYSQPEVIDLDPILKYL